MCDAQGGGEKKATNGPVTRNQAEVDEQKRGRERERRKHEGASDDVIAVNWATAERLYVT